MELPYGLEDNDIDPIRRAILNGLAERANVDRNVIVDRMHYDIQDKLNELCAELYQIGF